MKYMCWLCHRPVMPILLYKHRYAHVGCAEHDYYGGDIPDKSYEERLKELKDVKE